MHRGDELRAFVRERREAQQDVCGVFDLRERAASAMSQRVRHLRARVATPHHLRGDLVAAPAEHGAPDLRGSSNGTYETTQHENCIPVEDDEVLHTEIQTLVHRRTAMHQILRRSSRTDTAARSDTTSLTPLL